MAPSTSLCACCNRSFKNSLMLKCCVCNKLFKHSCVNITVEELHVLSDSSKGYDWTCIGCRELGNELKDLKALILNLQKDISDLKSESISNLSDTKHIDIEEIIDEVN